MKYASVKQFFTLLAMVLLFTLSVAPRAWSGSMRLTMSDGKTIDAPYFWEQDGHIKFEVPGGVAGVPKEQVKSIQEIVGAKEFDPEVLVESPDGALSGAGIKAPAKSDLQTLIASKLPSRSEYQALNPEECTRELHLQNMPSRSVTTSKVGNYSPIFNQEGEFNEMVRLPGEGVMLVMRNVVSSRDNLESYSVSLILYDGEGNVLQKKRCEVSRLDIDPKDLRKSGIRDKLYAVVTTVKPDPRIKRYEIAAAQH